MRSLLYSNLVGFALAFAVGAGLVLLYLMGMASALGIPDREFTSYDATEAFAGGLLASVVLGFPFGWVLRRVSQVVHRLFPPAERS